MREGNLNMEKRREVKNVEVGGDSRIPEQGGYLGLICIKSQLHRGCTEYEKAECIAYFPHLCHPGLDPGSMRCIVWIPAFTGMTRK